MLDKIYEMATALFMFNIKKIQRSNPQVAWEKKLARELAWGWEKHNKASVLLEPELRDESRKQASNQASTYIMIRRTSGRAYILWRKVGKVFNKNINFFINHLQQHKAAWTTIQVHSLHNIHTKAVFILIQQHWWN